MVSLLLLGFSDNSQSGLRFAEKTEHPRALQGLRANIGNAAVIFTSREDVLVRDIRTQFWYLTASVWHCTADNSATLASSCRQQPPCTKPIRNASAALKRSCRKKNSDARLRLSRMTYGLMVDGTSPSLTSSLGERRIHRSMRCRAANCPYRPHTRHLDAGGRFGAFRMVCIMAANRPVHPVAVSLLA
jgi:hypothetical protein